MSDNIIDNAVKDLVYAKLGPLLKSPVQEIMNKVLQHTLTDISESLVIKLVAKDKDTFSVEFSWRNDSPDTKT